MIAVELLEEAGVNGTQRCDLLSLPEGNFSPEQLRVLNAAGSEVAASTGHLSADR